MLYRICVVSSVFGGITLSLQRLFIIFLLCVLVPLQAFALDVKDVRVGLHEDKTRLVMELDAPVDFQAFVLSEPYRMVVDLPDFSWKVAATSQLASAGISAVRHGQNKPGISRIVFDLNRPVSIQNAFMIPGRSGESDRLVIDFSNIAASLFSQVKGKSFGTLDPYAVPKSAGIIQQAPVPQSIVRKPLVVIDPGHGGVDPGALGKGGVKEKNIVLALGKALRDELQRTGRYRVVMTRETDKFIPLRDRVKFARKHEADLFISVHADSVDSRNVHGASVYTLSEKSSDAQTARLAARENKADLIAGIDLSTEDEDVVNILVDLARRDTMNQSKFFAGKLVDVMPSHGVETLERPHRYAGFAVLKAPDIPSVLVEAGFVSNDNEARRLSTPSYRAKIAKALRLGVDAYFDQVQKNQRQ